MTLESLGFSWVSVPVVNQCDFVKICAFHWLVSQLKINVTLECLCFSWVNVPVEDQGDLGMFVFFMG